MLRPRRAPGGQPPNPRADFAPTRASTRHRWSLVLMFHRDDHVAFFATCLNITVGGGRLVQRIGAIDDRFDLACLNQLCKETAVFRVFAGRPCGPGYELPSAAPRM